MTTPLRILHLEDSASDAELIQGTLKSEGLAFEAVTVETRDDYTAAIERGGFDLILCDYGIPGYSGQAALDLARAKRPEVPFIIVSGTIGEERAVKAMKAGASDYILKERLARFRARK